MTTPATRILLPCRAALLPAMLIALTLAAGCATKLTREQLDPEQFLHDEAFPGSSEYTVETPDEIFALDPAAITWLDRNILHLRDPLKRGKILVQRIFDQSALDLAYDSAANTTAAETFHSRTANCLSMSILAYSMAEYAGFDVRFREVDIPEYWERRDNFSLMNRHINLVLRESPDANLNFILRRVELYVDFNPLSGTRKPPTRPISISRVVAMFYNNKGIDALLDGNMDQAYAYLSASLRQDPMLDMAPANLGLLYNANGHAQWAEDSYRQATLLNRDNRLAAEGLAIMLEKNGQEAEARSILARLDRERRSNPWHHFIQGEEAFDAEEWEKAIRHYRRAIRLDSGIDKFHYGMAKTYLRLGDSENAEASLRRAERHADYADLKEKYRNKIDALSRM